MKPPIFIPQTIKLRRLPVIILQATFYDHFPVTKKTGTNWWDSNFHYLVEFLTAQIFSSSNEIFEHFDTSIFPKNVDFSFEKSIFWPNLVKNFN